MVLSRFQKLTGVALRKIQAEYVKLLLRAQSTAVQLAGKKSFIRGQTCCLILPALKRFGAFGADKFCAYRICAVPACAWGLQLKCILLAMKLQSSHKMALLSAIDGKSLLT